MALGMDGEEILSTFYSKASYERSGDGWRIPFQPETLKNAKVITDMIDADTGEVVVEGGKKLTPRLIRQLVDKGLKALKATDEDLYGNFLAEDIVNYSTGEIYLEAGDEIDEKTLGLILQSGFDEIPVLNIDHVNVGAYIRNTLHADKNQNRQKRCSTSTASCVRVSRRPWIRQKRCSTRCSSMQNVMISRLLAA